MRVPLVRFPVQPPPVGLVPTPPRWLLRQALTRELPLVIRRFPAARPAALCPALVRLKIRLNRVQAPCLPLEPTLLPLVRIPVWLGMRARREFLEPLDNLEREQFPARVVAVSPEVVRVAVVSSLLKAQSKRSC